jgi:hypothetical protein
MVSGCRIVFRMVSRYNLFLLRELFGEVFGKFWVGGSSREGKLSVSHNATLYKIFSSYLVNLNERKEREIASGFTDREGGAAAAAATNIVVKSYHCAPLTQGVEHAAHPPQRATQTCPSPSLPCGKSPSRSSPPSCAVPPTAKLQCQTLPGALTSSPRTK